MPGLRTWIRNARDRYSFVEHTLEVMLFCPGLCVEAYRLCFTDYRGSDAKPFPEVPIPLGPRPRALTLPLCDITLDQKTFEQSQSPLFSKLPLELRHRIYEYALGGAHMHLSIVDRRLLGARSLPLLPGLHDETETKVALTILRTCRIIYSESIEFLYATNYFMMSNVQPGPFVLPYIPALLVPQRLKSIRHLRINWSVRHFRANAPPSEITQWFAAWDGLNQMQGLHDLRIYIRSPWETTTAMQNAEYWEEWNSLAPKMFEPVKQMKVLRNFVITLPNKFCSADLDVGKSNCVFRRPVSRKIRPA